MGRTYMKMFFALAVLVVSTASQQGTENHYETATASATDGHSDDIMQPSGAEQASQQAGYHGGPDANQDRILYQPQVFINSPGCSNAPVSSKSDCKCAAIQGVMSSAVERLEKIYNKSHEDTEWRLEQLQTAISSHEAAVSTKLQDTKRQLDQLSTAISSQADTLEQLSTAVSDMTDILHNLSAAIQVRPTRIVTFAKDCSEVLANGALTSGVYTVQPMDDYGPVQVYCDMETDGGGWTVFQQRQDGSVDFYLGWQSYRQGFGDVDGEFWLGNDNLHRLTAQGDYELRVDLTDFEGNSAYAVYDTFRVADGSDNYRLTVGGYSGTAGDSLSGHNNTPFSTKDQDNDSADSYCAQTYHGAWWYTACHNSNLNGNYLGGATDVYAAGVVWSAWKGYHYSLESSEMKIKRTY